MKTCLIVLVVAVLAVPPVTAFAQQRAPDIPFESVPDFFKLPPRALFSGRESRRDEEIEGFARSTLDAQRRTPQTFTLRVPANAMIAGVDRR